MLFQDRELQSASKKSHCRNFLHSGIISSMFSYKDRISLTLSAGNGGAGALSFIRKQKQARGGPDGGDGGQGGSVFLSAEPQVSGFGHLKNKAVLKAKRGEDGGKNRKTGKKGCDLSLPLPLGTVVRNSQGQMLKDLKSPGKSLFLKGGRGGRGNGFFKNSRDQAPRRFQQGLKGPCLKLILELKPLIHIALLGKTNTGKSSFFHLVTGAKSRAAPYPYTTLKPHIGRLKNFHPDRFVLDIPGLEKGASKSLSRGLAFLRSLQRASLLLCFIDSLSPTALRDQQELEEELQAFDRDHREGHFGPLSRKKRLFILTKTDQIKKPRHVGELIRKFPPGPARPLPLSNLSKKGLKDILSALRGAFA